MHDQQHPHDSSHAEHSHAHHGAEHHQHDHDHDHDHSHDSPPRGPILSRRRLGLAAALFAALVLLWRTVYFVDETQYVFVTQFGQTVRLDIDPGLGLKWPYQSLWRIDRRLRMYDPPGREILTEDKENLIVYWYVCWRIPGRSFVERQVDGQSDGAKPPESDDYHTAIQQYVLTFLQSVGTAEMAEQRLEERIQAAVAAEISRTRLSQLVSLDPDSLEIEPLLERVAATVRNTAAEQFGIEVVDVRLKRFNYPESVKPDVFAEIRSERDRVARQYEAEGESLKISISSLAELHSTQIMAQAEREAAGIRAEGKARSIEILNAAHRLDPDFYRFLKTLETYREMLDERTTVVLSADSDLLRLLTRGLPDLSPSPSTDPTAQVNEDPAPAIVSDGNETTGPEGESSP